MRCFTSVWNTDVNSGIQILTRWRFSRGEWEVVVVLLLICSYKNTLGQLVRRLIVAEHMYPLTEILLGLVGTALQLKPDVFLNGTRQFVPANLLQN
ncbi:hypothetical protein VNO78_19141 [Psophocarpus tetragonolobus]|uniref:Uncharacterized protein n=1 Tax=Psophocarpus tetragonolobus TaxID=3891 RepID=A0AAN9S8C4_PSOTE